MTKPYIMKTYKILAEQYHYIEQLTSGLDADTRHFVKHVLVSAIQRLNRRVESLSIPISSVLIRKELRNTRIHDAEAAGLLIITPYSTLYGLCREFEIAPPVLTAVNEIGAALTAEQYLRAEKVNLFTGTRMSAAAKNRLYDNQRHPEPPLIIEAIRAISRNGCPFNLHAIELHLADMRKARDEIAKEHGERSKQYQRINGRYMNDFFCSRAILDQNPIPSTIYGVCAYSPAYSVASTGRIQQHRGGLQSCSRRMKEAAYRSIPFLHNYDLKASQLYALLLEMRDANLDPVWLFDYLSISDAKYVYAERAGMSVDCWKQCILSLVMGAPLPLATNKVTIRHYSIMHTLLEEAEGELKRADQLRANLTRVIGPLVEQLDEWHRYLIRDFVVRNGRQSRKGAYVMNCAGKTLYLNELIPSNGGPGRKAKARLSAFLLQGREAAFIHALTVLGPEYGFRPIANEHDGLIVIGEIPKAAEDKAARDSGFENAKLDEKPFVSAASDNLKICEV